MPNLGEATKFASQNAQLADGFGTGKGDFIFQDKLSAIKQAAGEFIKRVTANIEASDAMVTREIMDIKIVDSSSGIKITMHPQLVFQDKGINGSEVKLFDTPFSYKDKRPPIEPIIAWVQARGLQPRKGQTVESVAYAVREKIFKEGMKPRNLYTPEIPQLVEDVKKNLAGFVAGKIKELIVNKNKK